jgi:hypothetical protein
MFDGTKETSKQTSVVQQSLKEKHTCSHSGQDQGDNKKQKSKPNSSIRIGRQVRAARCQIKESSSASRAVGSDALRSWLYAVDDLTG